MYFTFYHFKMLEVDKSI